MNYERFRELLKEAIGTIPQKEFAEKSGLSAAHLNRLLKNDEISRPSIETITKIYKAVNGHINVSELCASCDYGTFEANRIERAYIQGLSEFEQCEYLANKLKDNFARIINDRLIVSSITDVVEIYKDYQLHPNFHFSKPVEATNPYSPYSGEYYINGFNRFTKLLDDCKMEYVTEIYFSLYFVYTSNNNIMLTDIAIDGKTLLQNDAIPEVVVDFDDETNFEELPYFAYAYENPITEESPEERLLKKVFGVSGEQLTLYNYEFGTGFAYNETPRDFVKFILNHKESFEDNEFETELLEELADNPEMSIAEVDELFKDYAFTNYDDNLQRFSGTGTFAAVVKIIYKESKDCPFQVSAGNNEILDLPSFIYVNEDEYSNKNFLDTEKKYAIDNYLKKYAFELHVPSYGSAFVYYSSEFDNENLYDQKELSYDWEMFLS